MKHIFILVLLSLIADASYEKAETFYEKKAYKKAIEEAKSSKEDYSNPKLHLVWAKSEEALGNKQAAMSAYERVILLDGDNTQAKVSLYKIYKESERDSLADDLNQELQNYQLTPQQRSSLDNLEGKNINTLKAKATLSIGHDTNINVSAKGDDLDAYYGVSGQDGEIASLFARVSARVSYTNELEEKGGWYVRGDATLFYQNNFDASLYNMFVGGVNAGVGYSGASYTLYMPLGLSMVNYLDVSLLNQVDLLPTLNIRLTPSIILNLNAKYAKRTYGEAQYKGMGDSVLGGGFGFYYLVNQDYLYFKLLYEDYRSDETIHYAFLDKKMLNISLGANYNVAKYSVIRADYRYRNGNYKDGNTLYLATTEKRSDDYNQFELKFSHYVNKSLELFVLDRYVVNNSNYIPAQYSKNIVMFGLSTNY